METKELLKKVRKIEIKTKGLSKQVFSGEYHSAFKGRGMSFSEVRSYQYGDDVRNIDWNVTARTGEPHVKIFEEERELTVMLLVDVSQSVQFGTKRQFKSEMITELCAVLAFSAINNNDKVGVLFFSDQIEKFIPPKKGKTHILRIIRELLDFEAEDSKTNIAQALQYMNNLIKKRCICFVLSDFIADNYEQALRIVARKHDLIGVHISDPVEEQFPSVGLIRARDAETGRIGWIDSSNAGVRKRFEEWFKEKSETFESNFRRTGADVVHIRSDEDYARALHRFFQKRINA
ncbi:MAG: DUF58 domain-containing protein [Bacteroidetes bacterium]|nr:DUF58 domain-containing protein [Bacteroidota bacterium]